MSLPLPEKIPLPHDMVIFPNRVLGEMAGGLKSLQGNGFGKSALPKMKTPNPSETAQFRFGELFLGKWQDVPTWEVVQA